VKLQPHRREEMGFSFLHRVAVEKPHGRRFALLNYNHPKVGICSEFAACASSLEKEHRERHCQQVPPSCHPSVEDRQRAITAIRSKVFKQI